MVVRRISSVRGRTHVLGSKVGVKDWCHFEFRSIGKKREISVKVWTNSRTGHEECFRVIYLLFIEV